MRIDVHQPDGRAKESVDVTTEGAAVRQILRLMMCRAAAETQCGDHGPMMSLGRALALVDQVADHVDTYVTNPAERAAIANELGQLLDGMDQRRE